MEAALIIIQARMSSTRLPEKILKAFAGGKCILQIQLEIIKKYAPETNLVVATTTNSADDVIEKFCKNLGVDCFRGDEQDVLQRFIDCATTFNAQNVVRVCSDNPFLNGTYLRDLLLKSEQINADYLSYKDAQGLPAIKTHWGLFAEFVKLSALKKAAAATGESFFHEHVTNYIYGNPKTFHVELINAPEELFKRTDLRFTIDTEADFIMAQNLYTCANGQDLVGLLACVDANNAIKEVMKTGIEQFSK